MRSVAPPLLEVHELAAHFPVRSGLLARGTQTLRAVDGVSFDLEEGETFGIVGESGCGKSTLARTIVRLQEPTGGTVTFQGRDITHLGSRQLRSVRRELQIVFQNPHGSLNPRKRIGVTISDPLAVHKIVSRRHRRREVERLLKVVGLSSEHYDRYPHEFSGGQRQRIGIARALALKPRLLVLDEPVSALDVSIQAQVLNLLADLQEEFALTYILIAHDLAVVRQVSDRVGVMYLGRLVEIADAEELYRRPIMPYTEALLRAIPLPDPELRGRARRGVLQGEVPSPVDVPSGCRFRLRCPYATAICARVDPPLRDHGGGHVAACHHPRNVGLERAAV